MHPRSMPFYTSLAVFLFSSISLVVPSGFSLGAVMLLLGALALLRPGTLRVRLDREDGVIVAAFLLFFFVSLVNNLLHHAPAAEYDQPLRFVLALPALMLLRTAPPRASALWSGVAVGAIAALLLSLWQLELLNVERPSGSTNPIQYGNISMVLGIASACGLLWAASQPRRLAWFALLGSGAIAGAAASLISASRGSWLALLVCLAMACWPLLRTGGPRLLLKVLLCSVVALGCLWLLPRSDLRNRVEIGIHQANQYQRQDNADTSIGARLEMLRVGLLMAPQHLLLGWGKQGMFDYKAKLVDSGQAAPSIREHTHLHNEYLDAVVKHGIPGLLAVLILFVAPLLAFSRRLGTPATGYNAFAMAGAMLMASYLAFGLTQAFLTHNNGVMILAFMTVILWSCARAPLAPCRPS